MTRRQNRSPHKKKRGGVLMGMRSGVQKVAGKVAGSSEQESAGEGPKPVRSKIWSLLSNVLSGALVVVAAAVLLKRCGVLKF